MCPISAFFQYLILVTFLLLACYSTVAKSLSCAFTPKNVTVHMHDKYDAVTYDIYDVDFSTDSPGNYQIYSEHKHVTDVEEIQTNQTKGAINGKFKLTGIFLGQTTVKIKNNRTNQDLDCKLDVIVVREVRVIDKVFNISVITLVTIIYINFGCAVDWGELRKLVKRPIGPVIGFCGQFIVMPLLSYAIGYILFPDSPEMRLGMFFTGVSPAGGASNIWTAFLDGNIDLSILMTTISTIAAFAMMPLWIFTLGKLIFDKAKLGVPYTQIASYVIALVVPLAIGYLIKRYLKKVGQFLARILKGFSSLLILFIVVFAIVTNLYLFELFSWRIVLAGMGLPYLGYLLGYLIAVVLRQPPKDCLAIAIETGIQNTGISIFLLRFALPQPQADLTTVAPVSVAIMTPFPLLFFFIYKKIRTRFSKHQGEESTKLSPVQRNQDF